MSETCCQAEALGVDGHELGDQQAGQHGCHHQGGDHREDRNHAGAALARELQRKMLRFGSGGMLAVRVLCVVVV